MRARSTPAYAVAAVALWFTACSDKKPDAEWQPGAAADSGPPAPAPAPAAPAPAATDAPKPAVAPVAHETGRVTALEGAPLLLRGSASSRLEVQAQLTDGDRVVTDDKSRVRIKLMDDSVLAIGRSSSVNLDLLEVVEKSRQGKLRVLAGRFWYQVAKLANAKTYIEVATPNAVAGIRGTTLWGDVERDVVCALEGTIELRSEHAKGKPVKLAAGNCGAELSKGKVKRLRPKPAQVQAYLDEVLIPDALPSK